VVVHLSVEDDPHRSVFIRQRLPASGAVDDGQPAMGERDPRAVEKPLSVRTAMGHASSHGGNRRPDSRIELTLQTHDATDAAHGSDSQTKVLARRACRRGASLVSVRRRAFIAGCRCVNVKKNRQNRTRHAASAEAKERPGNGVRVAGSRGMRIE
jgi:hypothetical protein